MRTEVAPKTIYLKDYSRPNFTVRSLELNFSIDEAEVLVTSRAVYHREHKQASDLVLDGECMELLSVSLDGNILGADRYQLNEQSLSVIDVPDDFTLEIITKFDPAANTALEGLYKSGDTYCTQCEAQGFRRITYFQDRPDVMTIFTTRIEASKKLCPVLLSNGNLVEEGDLDGGRHYTVWHDPFSKPCYLFALVAGKLEFIQDHFVTRSGRKVDLRIYVREGDQPQCYHAMESLKKSMKWDEDVYGCEYELDRFNIVAVSDFNMGAMENTSLNIFNTALVLAHKETATDLDFYRVESVIGHEYFHNWTGNRVTCRDWFQLSLKEGLTVFRDQEFSADMNSRSVQRIDDVEGLRSMQFPEDGGPLAHPVRPDHYIEINNFYTTTVYEKGAEVVRMQATLLGPEKYREATDLYFDRYDGHAVTCDDFVQCMADVSGLDFSQFKLWYSQAGTPEVAAKSHYDVDSRRFTLTLSQYVPDTPGQSGKLPMHIPVAVGLLGQKGNEIIETQVLHLRDKEEVFIFENVDSRPTPSILRNFSAPVRLTTDLSEDDLRFLMVHDTDGFNRWESSQTLSMRLINRMIDAVEAGHLAVTDRAYLDTVSMLLRQALDGQHDMALIARMLALPDFSIISQERQIIEPDHIHLVLMRIKYDVVDECEALLKELYYRLNVVKDYAPDPVSMAERSLKSVVLSLLTCKGDEAACALARGHYFTANNMTDRMMAVNALIDTQSQDREDVLAQFYSHYKDYPLVIDKWFAAQARAIRPSTIDDIRKLAMHPDFNIKNPNRVRSLFASFAMRNPVAFHSLSGEGYNLFGDFIEKLDPVNPQIASRLLTSLRDWKQFNNERQNMIKIVLEKIVGIKNLSPNSFEIASKILGD
ncbi:MAG: aminopeptidase N [Pseudobdellovibrionaceae bacterium]|jgi:aminopeptidase N|nr:aminopeptidase N [Pseudobdellovibrionaceae bacterium]